MLLVGSCTLLLGLTTISPHFLAGFSALVLLISGLIGLVRLVVIALWHLLVLRRDAGYA